MTQRIGVMVNGLPGKMATEVAELILGDSGDASLGDFVLSRYSLTGPEVTDFTFPISKADAKKQMLLIPYNAREAVIDEVKNIPGASGIIAVDFSLPKAVNDNADFYCRHNIPFVMGTTGGDRKALEERVRNSQVCAVIAPNMAKQIVALQAQVQDFASTHANSLAGCKLNITESHQAGKVDTSGTAKAMVEYFKELGIEYDVRDIIKVRDVGFQLKMGIPKEHLEGHGWHSYTLTSPSENKNLTEFSERLFDFLIRDRCFEGYSIDNMGPVPERLNRKSADGSVLFEVRYNKIAPFELVFRHNVNGRSIYGLGTIEAIRFLRGKIDAGEKGQVYSMIDVSRG